MKNSVLVIIIIIIIIAGIYFFSKTPATQTTPTPLPTTGTAVQPTGPDNTGQSASKDDLIKVTTPTINQLVGSPLTIQGKARGSWYFEASFPVKLVDANGTTLASAPAQAQGDWMTTNYVPFSVTLTFSTPTTPTGKLILQKDNPSGLPQNDDELQIPVHFGVQNTR